jgi:hypothetical protein
MKIPEIDKSLADRIKLVRRDIGNLLFHFTRTPEDEGNAGGEEKNALIILRKILQDGKLIGSSLFGDCPLSPIIARVKGLDKVTDSP